MEAGCSPAVKYYDGKFTEFSFSESQEHGPHGLKPLRPLFHITHEFLLKNRENTPHTNTKFLYTQMKMMENLGTGSNTHSLNLVYSSKPRPGIGSPSSTHTPFPSAAPPACVYVSVCVYKCLCQPGAHTHASVCMLFSREMQIKPQ